MAWELRNTRRGDMVRAARSIHLFAAIWNAAALHLATLTPTPIGRSRCSALAATVHSNGEGPLLPEDVPLAFGEALKAAWNSDGVQLRQLLTSEVAVETPIWKCDGLASYIGEIDSARRFFSALSAPKLTVLSHCMIGDGRAQVSWILGVEWPAAWRPRVNILGQSTLSFSSPDGPGMLLVHRVEESWHQTPGEAFWTQVLPRLRDMTSLWATPTAEHLPMAKIGQGSGYDIVRVPPMLALQSEWIETGSLVKVEQAPLPPAFAFTGEVKRSAWYNTVSPGFVERSLVVRQLDGGMTQTGQRRRWFAPLPLRFVDEPSSLPDPADSADVAEGMPSEVYGFSVQYVRRPAQLLAVKRLRQIPSNEVVLSSAIELAKKVEQSGKRVAMSEGRPVVMQISGDLKYGFNDRGELSMTTWLSVPDVLREEAVAVVIEDVR